MTARSRFEDDFVDFDVTSTVNNQPIDPVNNQPIDPVNNQPIDAVNNTLIYEQSFQDIQEATNKLEQLLKDWKLEYSKRDKFELDTYSSILADSIRELPKPYPVVFRGLPHESFKRKIGDAGDHLSANQFWSTSRNKEVAMSFLDGTDVVCAGTLFEFEVRYGIDVREHSKFPTEEEILIPPFHMFTIRSIREVEENQMKFWHVLLDYIDKPYIEGGTRMFDDTFSQTYTSDVQNKLEQEISKYPTLIRSWREAEAQPNCSTTELKVIYCYTSDSGFYRELNEQLRVWCNKARWQEVPYFKYVLNCENGSLAGLCQVWIVDATQQMINSYSWANDQKYDLRVEISRKKRIGGRTQIEAGFLVSPRPKFATTKSWYCYGMELIGATISYLKSQARSDE